MTTVFHAWGFIEIQSNLRRKKLHRTNQSSNFVRGSFSNTDNVKALIQSGRESQPQHLKRWFFLKKRPIHFHINSTGTIRPFKRNELSFLALKSTSHFLLQSTVSPRSDASSGANSSCCQRSYARSH